MISNGGGEECVMGFVFVWFILVVGRKLVVAIEFFFFSFKSSGVWASFYAPQLIVIRSLHHILYWPRNKMCGPK